MWIILNPFRHCFNGTTPAHAAATSKNSKILELLVEAGADLRLRDSMGRSVEDWCQLMPDAKKRMKKLDFIDRARHQANCISDGITQPIM